MPDVAFPELLKTCNTIGACIVVEKPSPELAKWASDFQGKDLVATIDDGRWIEATADDWRDRGVHFHLEIHRGKVDRGGDDKPWKSCDRSELVKFITGFIELAGVGSEQFANSRCDLAVPLADLPQHGTIATLLAFERRACDASFGLSAATLDIEDDFFDKLVFKLNPKDKEVRIDLWASNFFTLDHEFLDELGALLGIGVDCFVFEQISREPSYG